MDIDKLKVPPGGKFRLSKRNASDTLGMSKSGVDKGRLSHAKKLAKLQDLLYAGHEHAILIALQAMDAGGKDGTIKHVMSGVNPQGCSVTSFKQPTPLELSHDFLWRVHAAVPPKGMIGIFNRSHYEDVLITRVHGMISQAECKSRYEDINNFEKILTRGGVHIVKFFLHIDSDEQERRFAARLDDPDKNWKSSSADFSERRYWDQYQDAYENALAHCSTKDAPWYVIPANHKWFRNYAVAEAIIQTMESLKMKYPVAKKNASA
jgi:PPK2 family polyphosphate:nucleotide phosphotransferase